MDTTYIEFLVSIENLQERSDWCCDNFGPMNPKRWLVTTYRENGHNHFLAFSIRFVYHADAMAYKLKWM